jgi:Subtilase family
VRAMIFVRMLAGSIFAIVFVMGSVSSGGSERAREQAGQREPLPAQEPDAFRLSFLDQIKAPEAWQAFMRRSGSLGTDPLVVAVVDTGVDLQHPLLRSYLVPGVNLRFPDEPPHDRMGHGTKVAGVIASVWGAGQWRTPMGKGRIMPVKVMEDGSDGQMSRTIAGIREAISRKARIIVLAQGSWRHHPALAEAVAEAEQQGVLIVAAVGNAKYDEQGRLAFDHPLYFPAAYPTVLAVGAATQDGRHDPTSNWGPGIDLVAPGENIRLTPEENPLMQNGTSFAAPQVAAVAALVWQLHPEYTPADVRRHLMQTARRTPSSAWRWDEQMGYGQVDAAQAIRGTLHPDPYEPNDRKEEAKPIASGLEVYGVSRRGDPDIFEQPIHEKGWLELQVSVLGPASELLLEAYDERGRTLSRRRISRQGDVRFPVGAGHVQIGVEGLDEREAHYRLISQARLGPDAMEPNDDADQAAVISVRPGIQIIEGTMDRHNDRDWLELRIAEPGRLTLEVRPLTPRFDPVLQHPFAGRMDVQEDQGDEGEHEEIRVRVRPGRYRICISDYDGNVPDRPYHVVMRYTPQNKKG